MKWGLFCKFGWVNELNTHVHSPATRLWELCSFQKDVSLLKYCILNTIISQVRRDQWAQYLASHPRKRLRTGDSEVFFLKCCKTCFQKLFQNSLVHRVLDRRDCLNFMMMPIDLAILDRTTFMWGCRNRFWSMMTPWHLVYSTLCLVL